ncbi:MAG: hypothetical protein DRJ47_03415 [Thermoprotei archaeon]|nr:MAG: hypothetical protein DRJ47_03415 [Thermoprotei archaeon]
MGKNTFIKSGRSISEENMGLDPQRTLTTAIFLNTLAMFIKIAGGLLSGSLALLADGFDSSMNVFTGFIVRRYYERSRKPPDEEHPYGHQRYEAYASIIVALVMASLGTLLCATTLHNLLEASSGEVKHIALPLALFSLAVNSICMFMLYKAGGSSLAIRTESKHLSIDVFESIVVLIGVTLAIHVSRIWDLIATQVIVGIIFYNIYTTLKEIREYIMDISPGPEILEKVSEIISSTKGIKGFHALRARQVGECLYMDFHLIFDEDTSLEKAHKVASIVEEKLKKNIGKNVDITIHLETEKDSTP